MAQRFTNFHPLRTSDSFCNPGTLRRTLARAGVLFAYHLPADPMTYFQDLTLIRYHDGPHCADDWQCPLFAVGFVLLHAPTKECR